MAEWSMAVVLKTASFRVFHAVIFRPTDRARSPQILARICTI
jgi:hypothetical protein